MKIFYPKDRLYMRLNIAADAAPGDCESVMAHNPYGNGVIWCYERPLNGGQPITMHVLGTPEAVEATEMLLRGEGLLK